MHILKAFINNKEKKRMGLKNMTFWKSIAVAKIQPSLFIEAKKSWIIFKQQRLLLSQRGITLKLNNTNHHIRLI